MAKKDTIIGFPDDLLGIMVKPEDIEVYNNETSSSKRNIIPDWLSNTWEEIIDSIISSEGRLDYTCEKMANIASMSDH